MAVGQIIYVDPSIDADSGAGTVGDPYGDLQYAFDQTTSSGDGTEFRVKSGTDEVLTASLSTSTFGGLSYNGRPVWITSYGGGRAVIDLNGNQFYTPNDSGGMAVNGVDFHSGPSTDSSLHIGRWELYHDVYVYDTDGHGIEMNQQAALFGARIENVGGSSYSAVKVNATNQRIMGCYIKQGASRTMKAGIEIASGANAGTIVIQGNIISIDGASDGIHFAGQAYAVHACNNTILSSAGTGQGIYLGNFFNWSIVSTYLDNYIEGFSGTGGVGFSGNFTQEGSLIYRGNTYYNNATHEAVDVDLPNLSEAGTVLTATGLSKSGSDTYANRFTYFEATDDSDMESGWPEAA